MATKSNVENFSNADDQDPYADHYVKMTFYITYVFLLTTGTITFIEAMRTNDSKVRHILNLETCISVVAAFFYSKFVSDIECEIGHQRRLQLFLCVKGI